MYQDGYQGKAVLCTPQALRATACEQAAPENIGGILNEIADCAMAIRANSGHVADALDGAIPEVCGQEGKNPGTPSTMQMLRAIRGVLSEANANVNRAKRSLGI